jgi:hypothetical protein
VVEIASTKLLKFKKRSGRDAAPIRLLERERLFGGITLFRVDRLR